MPVERIQTGTPHLEDISLARDLIPTIRDGNAVIYDLAPTPEKPETQKRGLISTVRLVGASILTGIGK